MNRLISLKRRLTAGAGFTALAALGFGLSLTAGYAGGDAKSTQAPEKPAAPVGLSGADLYSINCNRCHSERYPKEFQAAQWQTIMIHMRVRANIPAAQAREILKYLQQESGS